MHPTQQESQGQIEYDKILHKVEGMFGKFTAWRRIAMRYGRFVRTFFSAIHYRCCYHLLTQLVNPRLTPSAAALQRPFLFHSWR